MTLSEIEKAYLAGLFDAEGYVAIRYHGNGKSNRKWCQLEVSLANTDREIIEWLQEIFPGHTFTREYENEKHRTLYGWSITTQKAEAFLRIISKYSKEKKRQIDLVLEFRQTKKWGCNHLSEEIKIKRQRIYKAVRRLNHRGRVPCET